MRPTGESPTPELGTLYFKEEMMNNQQLSEHLYGEDAPKRCPECQAVWPAEAKFCGYDGEKLIDNQLTKYNKALNRERAKSV